MPARNKLIAALSVCSLFLLSSSAFACACCVDPGYYEISTSKPDAYIIGELEGLKFGTDVELYMSEAGFDGTKGLDDLAKDQEAGKSIDMNIVETFLNQTWRLNIKTANGREATLMLPMPRSMVKFKADIHDTPEGRETGLYKEFRFKGTVASGGGFLKKSLAKPAIYSLVFQGRGNGCDSSADFTHWRLEVTGLKADYAFYGKLMQ